MFPSRATGLVPRCICLRTSSVNARKVLREREGERDRGRERERGEGRERKGERGREKVNLKIVSCWNIKR